MSAKTSIEWCTRTWNPVRGCSRVSLGCGGAGKVGGCYAERVARRFDFPGGPYEGLTRATENGPRWSGVVRLIPEALDEPLRWRKPERVFVNSMSDLFHEGLPDEAIDRVFAVMMHAPRHTFQVLTKRPLRMRDYFRAPDLYRRILHVADHELRPKRRALGGIGVSNPADAAWRRWIWLGVSVEDQATADQRIPLLLETPSAVRWVSYEPALGPVDFRPFLPNALWNDLPSWQQPTINWIVVGGESGPGARRCDAAWIRSTVKQCRAAKVPCFVKQVGSNVIDRNDVGFDADSETWADGPHAGQPTEPNAWPYPAGGVEDNINEYREEYQGAPVRVHLKNRKGGEPVEWPTALRVRQFPKVRA